MKIHRFIVDHDASTSEIVIENQDTVHQIERVLRFQVGDELQLCDGQGHETLIRLQTLTKHQVVGTVVRRFSSRPESPRHVTLYVAILKREHMEWVVQKATEVGVRMIVPILTRRTVKQELRLDRLRTIAREAAEQSGRGVVPDIREPMSFVSALAEAAQQDVCYFFHTETSPPTSAVSLDPEARLAGMIGPEGGWDEEEVEAAQRAGCVMMSLGSFVLRGETAAVIAAYQMVNGLGLIA